MTNIVFLDCETTGLNPDIHDVWEIGLIVRDHDGDAEYSWMIRPDLTHADPKALAIGRYYERFPTGLDAACDPRETAAELAPLLDSAVVIGSNPAFDQAFLTRWLRKHGQVWAAHYRTVDVATLAAGYSLAKAALPVEPGDPMHLPYSVHKLSHAFGIDPGDYDRHTALGDCQWVRDLYSRITA